MSTFLGVTVAVLAFWWFFRTPKQEKVISISEFRERLVKQKLGTKF